jgi:hypothetical protein
MKFLGKTGAKKIWSFYTKVLIKILCVVHLKHSSFWPSADVKPILNCLDHAMPWKYMFALSLCVYKDLYVPLLDPCQSKVAMSSESTYQLLTFIYWTKRGPCQGTLSKGEGSVQLTSLY